MLEKLEVLGETRGRGLGGSTFVVRYIIGALPILESDADSDNLDSTAKVDVLTRVRINRTPDTEKDVSPSSHVNWRGERWVVSSRNETPYRTHYDLTLETTAK